MPLTAILDTVGIPNAGMVSMVLAAVGAINWGLVALLDTNIVTSVLGQGQLTTLVYVLVALAGVDLLGMQTDLY